MQVTVVDGNGNGLHGSGAGYAATTSERVR